MRISIWQQFSSNNSSSFTVVGIFETPDAAQQAVAEVRHMVEIIATWWDQHPDAWKEYDWSDGTSTPLEEEIGQRFGFTWPGAVEWYHSASIEVVLDKLVYITTTGFRPDTAGEPFDKVLTGLGGRGLIDGNFYGNPIGTIMVDITCDAPDEEAARTIADEKLAYQFMVRYEGRKLHFYDWPFSEFDLPELIEALKVKGCTNIEYKLSPTEDPAGKPVNPNDADLLIKLLSAKDNSFDRDDIVRSLWEIGDPRAVDALIDALKDPDKWVSGAAARALADMGGSRAVEPLIEMMVTRRSEAAITALGKIGDARAVDPLIAMLNSDSMHREAINALGRLGESARQPLEKALENADGQLQGRIQEALDKVIETQDGGMVLIALRSEDPTIRQQALEEIRATTNLKALLAYLHNPTPYEMLSACTGLLVELEAERAIPVLMERARNNDRIAISALVGLGTAAVEPLITLTHEEYLDLFARQTVIVGIARIGNPSAVEFLSQILGTEKDFIVRRNVIEGLGKTGDARAVDALVKAFFTADPSGDIDMFAVTPLEQLNALDRLVEPLIESLENYNIWTFPAKVDLLARIGDQRAIPPLLALLDKAHPSYHGKIQEALQKLGYRAEE